MNCSLVKALIIEKYLVTLTVVKAVYLAEEGI